MDILLSLLKFVSRTQKLRHIHRFPSKAAKYSFFVTIEIIHAIDGVIILFLLDKIRSVMINYYHKHNSQFKNPVIHTQYNVHRNLAWDLYIRKVESTRFLTACVKNEAQGGASFYIDT